MRQSLFRPWPIVTILCLLYCLFIVIHSGSPLTLLTLGTQFSQGIPPASGGTEGYDGQFNFYIARDPATAAAYIDVPAYRFQRILFPALGRLIALGQETLLPWSFLLIGLISLAAGTALMEALLRQHHVSQWYALAYGLTLGVFGSVRLSLSEPLAYALVLGAILLATHQRWLWSALLFALAALAKETTLLFPAGYTLYLLYRRDWKNAGLIAGVALLPFTLWQLVLYNQLGAFGIGSGGAQATSFEWLPFAGVARIITESPAEARLPLLVVFGVLLTPFVLLPTLWALYRCWHDLRSGHLSSYTFLLLITAIIMPFVPFSTYREPIGILRFIIGLQIAVILYAANQRDARALRYSTVWVLTILFVFSLVEG